VGIVYIDKCWCTIHTVFLEGGELELCSLNMESGGCDFRLTSFLHMKGSVRLLREFPISNTDSGLGRRRRMTLPAPAFDDASEVSITKSSTPRHVTAY
jgi:hypothetical protein